MPRKKTKTIAPAAPQKSSAAQFLTYVASVGTVDENIWMSQKMLAAMYGVEISNIAYHLRKLFADAEQENGSDLVSTFIAQQHAEMEFEKFKPIQDQLFLSDYDRYLLALEEEVKRQQKRGKDA